MLPDRIVPLRSARVLFPPGARASRVSIHWLQRLVSGLIVMKHLAKIALVELLPAYRTTLEMLRLGF
jgi:hypothetical protein